MEAFPTCLLPRVSFSQQQKVVRKQRMRKKMLISYVRSRNVYENKGNSDKMPGEKADFFGNWTNNEATFWPPRARKDGQIEPRDSQSTGLTMCRKTRGRDAGNLLRSTETQATLKENMARKCKAGRRRRK